MRIDAHSCAPVTRPPANARQTDSKRTPWARTQSNVTCAGCLIIESEAPVSTRQERQSPRPQTSAELALADYPLLAEFRHWLARFLAFSADAARAADLAPRQHQALLAIKGHPRGTRVTVGDLAERLAIGHHSAVSLVDRLVESGCLVRRTDKEDRRRAVLSLTPPRVSRRWRRFRPCIAKNCGGLRPFWVRC